MNQRNRLFWGAVLFVSMRMVVLAQAGGHGGGPPAKVEFENEKVQVLRIRVAPHAVMPMHDVTERVVVWLTDANLKVTLPDGTAQEMHMKAGEAGWITPGRHAGTNLSDQPIEFIAVILKERL